MKAFVITLENNTYSNEVASRCIQSATEKNLDVKKFFGIDKVHAKESLKEYGLTWTWANGNMSKAVCEKTNLQQFPYTTSDLRAKIGCSMSHFLLWKLCVELSEPILILEHDAVFLRELPTNIKFNGICQINDPAGATRRGTWWGQQMKQRGTIGVHEKIWITNSDERDIPDGLAGNSAYLIKPWAAQELIDKCYELGIWPNDAIMCKQLFPYLEEYYPFITKVIQSQSTTTA